VPSAQTDGPEAGKWQAPVPASVLQQPAPALQPTPFGAQAHVPSRQMPLQHWLLLAHVPVWMQLQIPTSLLHVPEQQSASPFALQSPPGSVWFEQQMAPRRVVPLGQGPQLPPRQAEPAAQLTAHDPQYTASELRSAQTPPQQVVPVGQTWVQLPQWSAESAATQAPLHAM
jgi:hypothetical protein